MIATKPKHKLTVALPSDREIVLTRTFDAPRRLVFEALTKPEHVRIWWGCENARLSVCDIDLRVGGCWRYVFDPQDGGQFEFHGVFREIVVPERIVQTSTFEMYPDNETLQTVTLAEKDGETTLVCSALYPSLEVRNAVIAAGVETGARESYDRLEDMIRKLVEDY